MILVPGPKVLEIGGTGTGKTYSLRTIIDAGMSIAAVFTEPGMEVLADIPCSKGMHWMYIPPAAPAWADMIDSARKINTMSFEGLAKLGDVNKTKYGEFMKLLTAMSNFTCDRCGKVLGSVDTLDENWCVVNDSMSGINTMAMNLVIGSKPVKSMADWGVAMDNLERYITKFTVDIKTMAVMIGHTEREVDEITGSTSIMTASLGRKLAPRIPRFFSDVILTKRDGAKFAWSTAAYGVDLKARNLPISDNLPPDFRPIIEAWRKRNAQEK